MNGRRGVVAGVAFLALLLMLLFPPYFAMDRTSEGRVHAFVGYHPVWAPPTRSDALTVLAGAAVDGAPDIVAENLDIRVNRVRLISQMIGLVVVALIALALLRGRPSWWTGARGEWLVVAQLLLMALVFFGPRTAFGWPAWAFPFPHASPFVGGALMAGGGALLVAGIVCLRRALTPLPFPREGGELVETGAYAWVRHPMYCGGLVLALGWALVVQSWLTLGYVAVLGVFLDAKSRREERWLSEKFPDYASYQRRVCKLVPFVY